MVQLKSEQPTWHATPRCCFNSCMVQLKSALRRVAFMPAACFNSCMVQLKWERARLVLSSCTFVLIPVWCNWNQLLITTLGAYYAGFNSCMVQLKFNVVSQENNTTARFNSCMVQLKFFWVLQPYHPLSCFNSCMVQLKFSESYNHITRSHVLIPVWCNWNFLSLTTISPALMF